MDLPLLVRTVISELLPLLQAYLDWSREQPRSLTEREEALDRLCAGICQVLLRADAHADDVWLRRALGRCACGGRFHSKGQRKRTVVTSVGTVIYRRRYYECEACQGHCLPVDAAWGVTRGSLSERAKRLGVEMASALPFREARLWLEQLGGMSLSLSTLWRVTQRAGAALLESEQERLSPSETRSGAAAFLQAMRGVGRLSRPVMAVDGLFVRISRQWREVKLGVVGQLSEEGEWVKGQTSYLASLESAERFRQRLVRHALARGITRDSPLVILSDGADWIAALPRRFYPKARHILDYWHAKQYLWKAAHRLFGEGTPKAQAWVQAHTSDLWKGDIDALGRAVWAEVKRLRGRSRALKAGVKADLEKTLAYLEERKDALQYETFRRQGDPTGSGPAEGGCKAVVQSRMKRSGMNWSPSGAEAMLALRCRYCERLYALP